VPCAITVPVVVALNVAEQVDVVVLKLDRVHGDPVKLPEEVPPFVKPTVPRGADAVPDAVSLTVAVQVIVCPTRTEDGVHATVVAVDLPPETVTVLLGLGPLPL
jgi:hypothetical protein